MTRLLVPELFGIMLIVNTFRTGAELLSDVGIAQGVIRSSRGEDPALRNTAWTIQLWRGVALFVLCLVLAKPIARMYSIPEIVYVLPAAGCTFLISAFTSTAIPILRRRMEFRSLAIYEICTALAYSVFQIGIAFVWPSIWALVLGLIFGSFASVAGSFLLSNFRQRLAIDRSCLRELLSFGKWITVSSAIYFFTMNFDRIYLPSVVSLGVLGVFAIARTITDIVGTVFVRLNNSVLFPHISSQAHEGPHELRRRLTRLRQRFMIASGVALGGLAASIDLLVHVLFDSRYHAAGWMASILMIGSWFAVLASVAEVSLLGLGRPQAAAFSNGTKLVWLLAALPLTMTAYGLKAAILTIAGSELVRYLSTLPGQRRAHFSFMAQDLVATTLMAVVTCIVLATRQLLGFPIQL